MVLAFFNVRTSGNTKESSHGMVLSREIWEQCAVGNNSVANMVYFHNKIAYSVAFSFSFCLLNVNNSLGIHLE